MRKTNYNRSFLTLILFSLIAGFITFALFAKTLPLIASKTLYFCQQFISNTLLEIPKSFPNTIILALGTALLLGVLSLLIQLGKTHRLVKRLLAKQVRISKKVKNILVPLGLNNKVYIIRNENLFSFCFGIFSPNIIITTHLINTLNEKELEAVFLHEQAHLRSHDPLKILLGKTIASTFFFLPIFSELNNNMNTDNEILADRFVTNVQQNSSYLKNALKKILTEPKIQFALVPAIGNPDHLEARIRQLVNPILSLGFKVSLGSILTSLVFIVISGFILQAPVVNAFQMEPSYFLCSSDNACRRECNDLFSKNINFSSSPPQAPKYKPSYR
ncbi:M56 family metallopeptidase [Candidatus Roizmanbacteria bacterium]|nr:M56 family metallopeptidase [Candidatus Roizmanbacteria bacterium]